MARSFLTFLLICFVLAVHGQDAARDSLKLRIAQDEISLDKAMSYAALAGLYQAQNQDSAIFYANKGLQYS